MSHHFVDLLDSLRGRLARMTGLVQRAVEEAVESVLTIDVPLAKRVIDGEAQIDEEEVKVEKQAIDLLALHQPAAGDLRLITTIIKGNNEFERIADCAANVAQHVPLLHNFGDYEPPRDLRVIGQTVIEAVRRTIKAFNLSDEALAGEVCRGDDVVDALYHQIVHDMLSRMESDGRRASADVASIMIAKNLERIADHCTNIAENVIYVHSGRIVRHMHGANA